MLYDMFLKLVYPLVAPLFPSSQFYIGYLLTAFVVALIVMYYRRPAGADRSFKGALNDVLPRKVFAHPSALLDYRFAVANHIAHVLLLGYILVGTVFITDLVHGALQSTLGENRAPLSAGMLASIVYTITLIVVYDAGNFAEHWLQHRIPILWEFHKVHHSAEVLTPVTASRSHPVGDVLSAQVLAVAFGLCNGLFLYIFAGKVAEVTVLGVNSAFFAYYTIGLYHLKHSHVWLNFPPLIREHLCSPAMHLIHHSEDPRHHDKNFAFIFTIWDRLAGTLYVPHDEEKDTIKFGLGDEEQKDFQTVRQLYLTPFRNVLVNHLGVRPERFGLQDPADKRRDGAATEGETGNA